MALSRSGWLSIPQSVNQGMFYGISSVIKAMARILQTYLVKGQVSLFPGNRTGVASAFMRTVDKWRNSTCHFERHAVCWDAKDNFLRRNTVLDHPFYGPVLELELVSNCVVLCDSGDAAGKCVFTALSWDCQEVSSGRLYIGLCGLISADHEARA